MYISVISLLIVGFITLPGERGARQQVSHCLLVVGVPGQEGCRECRPWFLVGLSDGDNCILAESRVAKQPPNTVKRDKIVYRDGFVYREMTQCVSQSVSNKDETM